MTELELLAPARNADIGIAAIDCGADAVYIAGPEFGARKAAGNSLDDIERLCSHAHRFGARIFVTVNILLRDDELLRVHEFMLAAQQAGVDAFIIRDIRICAWKDITVPLHASTQCAIRDAETALRYERAGCSRIVLERELSLKQIHEIRAAVGCEIECFVHGALCVCYSGDCRLSEWIDGRSADRGECIQACRSLYDLTDASGRVLVKNKALLSLKDFNLHSRLAELADAGVCSFKIEGRLKNISYVRNITRWYAQALDSIVSANPEKYRRASFGKVSGGFTPDPDKTFNRGYTSLFIDGQRGKWASMDAPKSMGEKIGSVIGLKRVDRFNISLRIKPENRSVVLRNGDGFAFVSKNAIVGFRGDVCNGNEIICKDTPGLHEGTVLFRNIDTAFEKVLERELCRREIPVSLGIKISGAFNIEISARTEDGREFVSSYKTDLEKAENRERAEAMIREGLGKRALHYSFKVDSISAPGALPLLSASTLNSMRRLLAEDLDSLPVKAIPMGEALSAPQENPGEGPGKNNCTVAGRADGGKIAQPLMRSKYCIRYELGLCPVHQGAKDSGPLFLINNGRRLSLGFDCKACEMTVSAG